MTHKTPICGQTNFRLPNKFSQIYLGGNDQVVEYFLVVPIAIVSDNF